MNLSFDWPSSDLWWLRMIVLLTFEIISSLPCCCYVCCSGTSDLDADRIGLLLQRWLRSLSIMDDGHVVSVYMRRVGPWHTHHPQFISYAAKGFHPLFHSNKFGSKHSRFNRRLFLQELRYGKHVKVYNETSSRSSRALVTRMIGIDKQS